MKHLFYLFLFFFISVTSIYSQEKKSHSGVEIGVTPWHFDTFSRQTPFSISGFIGVNYEHFFSNSYSIKATIGVHNVTYKWWNGDGYHAGKNEREWQTRLGLTIEPRYYFWENQQVWGNLFAGIPVSIETGPFQNNSYKTIFQTQLIRAIPIIGYQYYFTDNWFVEANAGIGWSLDRYPTQCYNDFDYLLGVRFGFAF